MSKVGHRAERVKPTDWLMALVQWLKLHAWKIEDRRFVPRSGIQVSKKQKLLPRSFVAIQYCGEPLYLRGSVLDLRPPGLEFRIICLEVSDISFISPSSGGWVFNYVFKSDLKLHSFTSAIIFKTAFWLMSVGETGPGGAVSQKRQYSSNFEQQE